MIHDSISKAWKFEIGTYDEKIKKVSRRRSTYLCLLNAIENK